MSTTVVKHNYVPSLDSSYVQTAVTIEGALWNTVVKIWREEKEVVFVIIKYMYFLNKIAVDCWLCLLGLYIARIILV